jgi:hypothetical protein
VAKEKSEGAPPGAVGLSTAIGALRDELFRAWWDGREQSLRFKPSPVELELQAAVTSAGTGRAGVKWWLLELGGEVSRESVVTQTLRVTLDPVMLDEQGEPLEFLVEAEESGDSPDENGDEAPLDAPG